MNGEEFPNIILFDQQQRLKKLRQISEKDVKPVVGASSFLYVTWLICISHSAVGDVDRRWNGRKIDVNKLGQHLSQKEFSDTTQGREFCKFTSKSGLRAASSSLWGIFYRWLELKWTEVDPSYSFANFGIAEFDLEVLRRESHFARYFDEGAISCFWTINGYLKRIQKYFKRLMWLCKMMQNIQRHFAKLSSFILSLITLKYLIY